MKDVLKSDCITGASELPRDYGKTRNPDWTVKGEGKRESKARIRTYGPRRRRPEVNFLKTASYAAGAAPLFVPYFRPGTPSKHHNHHSPTPPSLPVSHPAASPKHCCHVDFGWRSSVYNCATPGLQAVHRRKEICLAPPTPWPRLPAWMWLESESSQKGGAWGVRDRSEPALTSWTLGARAGGGGVSNDLRGPDVSLRGVLEKALLLSGPEFQQRSLLGGRKRRGISERGLAAGAGGWGRVRRWTRTESG